MILLPDPPRRSWLMSFWIVMSVCAGLVTGGLAALLGSGHLLGFGVSLAIVLALSGRLRPEAISLPYRAWNKLARYYGSAAEVALTAIWFYIVFAAVGKLGSSLRLARPTSNESLWLLRRTCGVTIYGSHHDLQTKPSNKKHWTCAFVSWTLKSGNVWAICLLPFLLLISIVETPDHETFPSNIYTLF